MTEVRYLIVVDVLLDRDLADWFGGVILGTDAAAGTTTVLVSVPDQAGLHGILAGIRDLNLPLRMVNRLPESTERQ